MSSTAMRNVLRAAAFYNIGWGAWVVLFPNHYFELTGMDPVNHTAIWQGTGMIVGVYGLGYWWASYQPLVHWPIVAVGFLGKLFGPIGYLFNVLQGTIPPAFGYTLITNDLIWWIPFAGILYTAYQTNRFQLSSAPQNTNHS